jgi:hypothetical protein
MIVLERISEYFQDFILQNNEHGALNGVVDFSMNKSNPVDIFKKLYLPQISIGPEISKKILFHTFFVHINGFTCRIRI